MLILQKEKVLSAIINCHNLTKCHFKEGKKQVILPKTSLVVDQGSMLAITGSSGSGKSTLLNILGLLDQCTHGSYVLQGHDCTRIDIANMAKLRQKSFGYIFQQYWLIKQLTVLENIQLPLYYLGMSMATSKQTCYKIMEELEIAQYADRYPQQLSGGQQQRVSIARAISTEPPILLADEPTGALDQLNTSKIMGILKNLNQTKQTTIIIVTHDKWVASQCTQQADLPDLFTKPSLIQSKEPISEVAVC